MTPSSRTLPWLLAIVPFGLVLYVVLTFGVPVPYLDEWDFVPLLQKMYGGTLALEDIWKLHNEHRLFFPQLIMLGLAKLTDWDLRYEMGASVVFAVGIFLLLAYQARITSRRLALPGLAWAIPLFSLIVFSISQYQNWLWGWQLEIFLSVLAVIGGIVLLANPPFTWIRFIGAALAGVVASYSFGNGGVFWLTGLFVLWVAFDPGKERWIRLTVWLVLAGLTMGLYFYHYERLEEHPSLILVFSEPIQYLAYVFKYIGNICAQYTARDHSMEGGFALVYGIVGVALLIWAILMLRRHKQAESQALTPFFAMILYALVSAMVIGIGRLGVGVNQAVSSRYCTVTAPFWAAIVVLLLVLAAKAEQKPKTRAPRKTRGAVTKGTAYQAIAKLSLGSVTLLLLLGSLLALNGAADLSSDQQIGRQRLLTLPIQPDSNVDYRPIGALHPRPQIILERFPFLKERRLSIFREETNSASQPQLQTQP